MEPWLPKRHSCLTVFIMLVQFSSKKNSWPQPRSFAAFEGNRKKIFVSFGGISKTSAAFGEITKKLETIEGRRVLC